MDNLSSKGGDKKEKSDRTVFGGKKGWDADDWTDSDDRVRGGKSQSYLEIDNGRAHFYGTLDIETLGGAGFASQRTTGEDRKWDLSDYAGIQINVAKGDKRRYTFILKDDLPTKDEETGRDKATISWECDFELPPQTEPGDTKDQSVFIPWDSFNATYRGKLQKDAEPLDKETIKRMSIMCRSFFGSQQGDFSLKIKSIKALVNIPPHDSSYSSAAYDVQKVEKGDVYPPAPIQGQRTWFSASLADPRGPLTLVLGLAAVGYLIFVGVANLRR